MRNNIETHVRFCGDERVLRMVHEEGRWHASLVPPRKLDVLTGKYADPAPRGTKLPVVEFHGDEIRIERLKDTAVSMEIGKLMVSRGVSVEEGWICVTLTSRALEYPDYKRVGHEEKPPGEWGRILDFHAAKNAQESTRREDPGIER